MSINNYTVKWLWTVGR